MKISAKALIVSLVLTATGLAETPVQPGPWSVIAAKDNHAGHHVVMLQATSEAQSVDGGNMQSQAKLDVICKNGKLAAIALEPAADIKKTAISFSGAVPTTRVASVGNSQNHQVDTWAVMDGGRTLTPYSEAFQGKLRSLWIERISDSQKMSFQIQKDETSSQVTFQTVQLSEALSSVGCTY